MKIVIAPDKFKGTLTAAEAARALADGLTAALPDQHPDLVLRPMADGGEGTLEALAGSCNRLPVAEAHDALGRPIRCRYGITTEADAPAALLEAAATIGLQHLAPGERNPLRTSSYGFGEALRTALEAGCRRCTVTIGGSATSDCGAGLLAALGCLFRTPEGTPLPRPTGADLIRIAAIDPAPLRHRLDGCRIRALSDVDNPLLGPHGAAAVFAPQKGADAEAVRQLEAGAAHFAALTERTLGRNCAEVPGSGAAGGIGWALLTYCDAELTAGADYVARHIGLEEALADASLVITGEGCFDRQSLHGKVVARVAALAARHAIPTFVLCGTRRDTIAPEALSAAGISGVVALTDRVSPAEAVARPALHLAAAAADLLRRLIIR